MFLLWQVGIVGTIDDMALGWHIDRFGDPNQALWHNGATEGYASYLAFSKQQGKGVVLLANSDSQPDATGQALLLQLLEVHGDSANSRAESVK